jgi:hypothetical protein
MEQKVVAHMKDGTIHKGLTREFDPAQETFYLLPAEGGGVPLRLRLESLKALFFVRDWVGNREFVSRKDFDEVSRTGRRMVVRFLDDEEMWGVMPEEPGSAPGFYLYPVDAQDNNVCVYVIRSSLKDLREVS